MSVINQVLRDLESRRAGQESYAQPPQTVAVRATMLRGAPSLRTKVVLGVLTLAAGAAAIGAGAWYPSREPTVALAESQPALPGPIGDETSASSGDTPQEPISARIIPQPARASGAVIDDVGETAHLVPAGEPRRVPDGLAADSTEPVTGRGGEPETVQAHAPGARPEVLTEAMRRKISSPSVIDAIVDKADLASLQASPPARESGAPRPAVRVTKTVRSLEGKPLAESHYRRAVELMKTEQQSLAGAALRDSLEAYPAHLEARKALAALLVRAGAVDEASLVVGEGLRYHPKRSSLTRLYARLQAEQGLDEQAVTTLEQGLAHAGRDAEYQALLAVLYQRRGDYAEAAEQYRRALVLQPENGAWLVGLAVSLDSHGEGAKALAVYRRVARRAGLSPEVREYVRGRIEAIEESDGELAAAD